MLNMKPALAAALALLLAMPAWAGSLSLSATTGSNACPTVTAPSGGATLTNCITGTDAQLSRVTTVYKELMGLNPATTSAQTFQAFAARLWADIKATTQAHEQTKARVSAETGVAPVDMQ